MKEGSVYETIWGMRLALFIIVLIFVSSWISCGKPDLIDALIYKITNGAYKI